MEYKFEGLGDIKTQKLHDNPYGEECDVCGIKEVLTKKDKEYNFFDLCLECYEK